MKISQREAVRLKSRVKKLEAHLRNMRKGWLKAWPEMSVCIGRADVSSVVVAKVDTARRLNHAVHVTIDKDALILWASDIEEI